MKVWRQIVALLLALAWLPMLHSCEIAHALGLELPAQHGDTTTDPPPGDHCDHCGFCVVIDSGGILSSVAKVSAPAAIPGPVAVRTVMAFLPLLAEASRPPGTGSWRGDPDRPPQRWRFVERAALSPRAPSGVV